MKEIVQKGDPVLRQIASEVPTTDFNTPQLNKILSDMSESLAKEKDGVAIAAPQIGVSLRIFVVSGKVYQKGDDTPAAKDKVFINPKLIKVSKKKVERSEGCLSVRPWYGKTTRAEKATVEACDEFGKKFTAGGTSFMAQIYQHEIDHLDGILFDDHATNLEEIAPELG